MFAPSCSPVCLHSLRPTWSPIQYIHVHPIYWSILWCIYDVSQRSSMCCPRPDAAALMESVTIGHAREMVPVSPRIFMDVSWDIKSKLTTCAPNKGWMRSERLQKIVSVDSLVKLPSCSPVGVDCNKVTVPDFQSALPQDPSSYGAAPRLFDPWFSWSVVL